VRLADVICWLFFRSTDSQNLTLTFKLLTTSQSLKRTLDRSCFFSFTSHFGAQSEIGFMVIIGVVVCITNGSCFDKADNVEFIKYESF